MKFRLFLIFILLWAQSGQVLAQCPVTQFSAPDSACGGVTINLTNTPTSGVNYQWDMCPGEMESTPVSFSSGADPNLTFNQQVKLVKQNGNYFLFVTNFFGPNSLARYDYGNSLNNAPSFYSYGALGLLNQPIGLDIVNENGTWYALVANYGSLRLTRIDLGTDISANIASAADLGQFGFNGPRSVRIAYDGINYFAFVTNDGGSSIIRIDFGGSITNIPSGSSPISNAVFSFTWGFDIKYDCVLGKWIGFTASYNLSQMHVLDFGNSPGNTPTIASSANTLINPSGLQVVRDGEDWHVLVISAASLKLENFKVPGNLLATPVSISADTVGSMNSPRELTILKDSSNYHCFLSNASGTISRIQWNSPCQNQPQYSEDPNGVSIVINNEGFNHVTLSANSGNGITSYFTDSVFIKPTPLAGFTNSITCVGNTIQFNDTTLINNGNITNWQWDFGDLTPLSNLENPTHQYATAGNYTVTLEVISDGGCFGVASKQISVNPLPIASFNFTNNQCATYPVAFTDLSSVSGVDSVISWSWNFGDNSPLVNSQNPIHPFDSSGSFQISLIVTASSGCIDSTSQSINILSTPVSVFTVSETCVNETAVFNNSSYISGGLSLSYIWSFGDNTTSFQSNPTHQYPSVASNYSVSLISTASNGCEDTLTTEIRIASKPIPAFSFSPMVVCVGNTVSFTSTSSGTGNDTIAQHIWDFGDQTGSTDTNPFHAFADTGYYNITLTVVSPTYCDSSITQQIYVIPSPTATFTAANTCLGTSVQFNPLITTPPGTQIDSVVWDFGDGTLFNGITSPQHQYSAPGTYNVNLTVYNNLLCTGSYTDSVIVYPLPQAAFNYSLACSGSEINFDGNLSTVSNDTINSWLWNFGNLGISTDAAPTFTFSDSGYYDVTLIASTIHGCSDTLTQNIFIIPSPDFNFSFVAPCLGQPTTFTYIDNTTPPAPANLLWDFGDNSTSGLLNPTHLYTNADTFNVSLLVLNPNTGCSNSVEKQLVVKPNPEPGFIVNNGCEGTVISFTDTSTILIGSIAAWSWDLDAAGQSNAQDPNAVFSDPGIFTINLTVTSALGCSANTSSQVTIYPEPQVSFVPDPIYGSPPLTVNFTNQTSGGINFNWDFGDGNNSQSENPSHIFQDTGSYAVTLQAISFYGCSSTYTQTITVLVPYIDAAVENTYLGINDNIARVSASIINKGNITITTMDLKAVVDDGTPITETWAGELKPGNSILYTFNAGYILSSGSNPSYACVTVNTVNGDTDDNISNNSKCIAQNTEFDLYGIYPNPFQDNLSISFNLPISGDVSFVIYDSKGSKVSEVNNISYKSGFNTYTFDSRNLSQGAYFISMQYRDFVEIIKAVRY